MTGAKDPNRRALEDIASALGKDLLAEMAFLGGAAVGLLVTDEAAPPVRTTKDVDCVIECAIPFATQAPCGLSGLSVWWVKLGIDHQHIGAEISAWDSHSKTDGTSACTAPSKRRPHGHRNRT